MHLKPVIILATKASHSTKHSTANPKAKFCISKSHLHRKKMNLFFRPKPMSFLSSLCLFLFFLSVAGDDKPSAYDVLEEYDFPVGILPKGIIGYELDRASGEFSAYLNGTCSFSLEDSYPLKYKSTIKGVISKDTLKNLKGVSVKVLFLWLNIVEVVRDRDELQFSVGIASADFPIDNFEECPQCGCGLDCVNEIGGETKFNGFLTSS